VSASRDQFLDAPGARLRLRDDGSGPAIVLLHGWAFDLELWEPQVEALAAAYRVIRLDRRGFGLSTGEPSLERDVMDLLFVLDQLELERVVLVGASQGARVALRAALAVPGRVAGLVLDAPPDEVSEVGQALTADEVPLAEYRELARGGDVAAVRRAWSRHPFTWLWRPDALMQELLAAVIARYPGRDLLAPLPPPVPLGPALSNIVAPALVLNGEHDTAARQAAGALLARALPGARRVLVPGAGHLPNLDQPQIYQRTLLQFFQECFGGKD
jgi:pimeloyl-ACP methyl ester carboxylesterase